MDFEHIDEYLEHNLGTKESLAKIDKEKIRRIVKEIKLHAKQIEYTNNNHNCKVALDGLFKKGVQK